jgi:hypothetical protein
MMKQEFVDETHEPAPPGAGIKWEVIAVDIEGRGLEPEVPPSPREQTRLHDLPGLEAQQDGVKEAVRQIAQTVLAGIGAILLAEGFHLGLHWCPGLPGHMCLWLL